MDFFNNNINQKRNTNLDFIKTIATQPVIPTRTGFGGGKVVEQPVNQAPSIGSNYIVEPVREINVKDKIINKYKQPDVSSPGILQTDIKTEPVVQKESEKTGNNIGNKIAVGLAYLGAGLAGNDPVAASGNLQRALREKEMRDPMSSISKASRESISAIMPGINIEGKSAYDIQAMNPALLQRQYETNLQTTLARQKFNQGRQPETIIPDPKYIHNPGIKLSETEKKIAREQYANKSEIDNIIKSIEKAIADSGGDANIALPTTQKDMNNKRIIENGISMLRLQTGKALLGVLSETDKKEAESWLTDPSWTPGNTGRVKAGLNQFRKLANSAYDAQMKSKGFAVNPEYSNYQKQKVMELKKAQAAAAAKLKSSQKDW